MYISHRNGFNINTTLLSYFRLSETNTAKHHFNIYIDHLLQLLIQHQPSTLSHIQTLLHKNTDAHIYICSIYVNLIMCAYIHLTHLTEHCKFNTYTHSITYIHLCIYVATQSPTHTQWSTHTYAPTHTSHLPPLCSMSLLSSRVLR